MVIFQIATSTFLEMSKSLSFFLMIVIFLSRIGWPAVLWLRTSVLVVLVVVLLTDSVLELSDVLMFSA